MIFILIIIKAVKQREGKLKKTLQIDLMSLQQEK